MHYQQLQLSKKSSVGGPSHIGFAAVTFSLHEKRSQTAWIDDIV